MYQRHKTWAQHEEEKKDIREKYFDVKMDQYSKKVDFDYEMKKTRRADRWNEVAIANTALIRKRSDEALRKVSEEKYDDVKRL